MYTLYILYTFCIYFVYIFYTYIGIYIIYYTLYIMYMWYMDMFIHIPHCYGITLKFSKALSSKLHLRRSTTHLFKSCKDILKRIWNKFFDLIFTLWFLTLSVCCFESNEHVEKFDFPKRQILTLVHFL